MESNPQVPHSGKNGRIIILLLMLIDILLISFIIYSHVRNVNKTAQELDAKVKWDAVVKGENPILEVKYRVIEVQFSDIQTYKNTVEKLGLSVDEWAASDTSVTGGATETTINQLRKAGFTVKVLYDSYEEYQKAVEEKYGK